MIYSVGIVQQGYPHHWRQVGHLQLLRFIYYILLHVICNNVFGHLQRRPESLYDCIMPMNYLHHHHHHHHHDNNYYMKKNDKNN